MPAGVGRTALGVAMIRAIESRRRDRLFHDPYAAAFLAAAPVVFGRDHRGAVATAGGVSSQGATLWSYVVVRTRFFDDYLLAATERGVRQIVLVAAGLDTRAYRLAWPAGVRVFELDLPEVLGFKQRVLVARAAVPRCQHRAVAADLREDWTLPLTDAGLRPDLPTAWLLEGLLIYLSADEVTHVLTAVGLLSAAGSQLAFEVNEDEPDTLRERAHTVPAIAEYAGMWKGGLPDTAGWLADHGWRLETHPGAMVAARYGRSASGHAPHGFLTATHPGR